MSQMVSTVPTKLTALGELAAVGEVLAGVKIHLYQNNLVPIATTPLASFTEATFTGYVAQAAGTWGMPYIGADSLPHVTAPGLQWQPTDAVTPNIIYGWYATNTAGTVLLFAAAFPAPIPMMDTTHAVVMQPDFIYGP